MKTIILLLFVFMALNLAAQLSPAVKISGTGQFDLSGESRYDTLAIPLQYDSMIGFDDIALTPTVHVNLKNRHQLSYQNAITLAKDTIGKRVMLVADVSRLKHHGSYDVLLAIEVN